MFLKSGSGAVLGAALALGEAPAHAAPAPQWDEEFDVVIVGSGLASAVAACAALDRGAKVLILEKMGVVGGTGVASNGTFAVVGSPQQAKAGITHDTWEVFYQDNLKEGQNFCQPELIKHLSQSSRKAYDFMIAHGAKFEDYLIPFPGQSINRLLQPKTNCLTGMLQPLYAYLRGKGATVRTRCRVDALVFGADGAVEGVRLRENYYFDAKLDSDDIENRSGTPRTIRARRGVICGTGGFAHDKPFMAQEFPQLTSVFSTQQIGSTASGFRVLANAGARMVHTSFFRPAFPQANNMGRGLMVDVLSGQRFTNETLGRLPQFHAAARLMASNGGRIPIAILDADTYPNLVDLPHFNVNIDAGWVTRHDSIESIAQKFQIPLDELKKTIARYNRMIEQGKDSDFGANLEFGKRNKLDRAPYYVAMVRPDLNSTLGGALINTQAQVIGLNTNRPIPGLYAAGEASGGVLGHSRLLGCATLSCTVFGMAAGYDVAARKA